ncbi:MAG: hypothetical protein OS112_03995 [Methanoregula sp.]|nr:MAG: hypothetical protein OS112_03995 [Methanoregula sp.]
MSKRHNIKPWLHKAAILVLILVFITSCGCIKVIKKNLNNEGQVVNAPSKTTETPLQSLTQPTGTLAEISSLNQVNLTSSVHTIEPVFPEDSFRVVRNLSQKNGETFPETSRNLILNRPPLYKLHFSPIYNATAVLVDVKHGPLVIHSSVSAKHSSPRISFLVITVRDIANNTIVTEDGYGGIYTSDPENQIVIYREGRYHVNFYGNQVEADISIVTGDSPALTGTARLPSTDVPDEYPW